MPLQRAGLEHTREGGSFLCCHGSWVCKRSLHPSNSEPPCHMYFTRVHHILSSSRLDTSCTPQLLRFQPCRQHGSTTPITVNLGTACTLRSIPPWSTFDPGEALARLGLARLLALHHAGVPPQQPRRTQRLAICPGVVYQQGTGDAMGSRLGLT